MRFLDNLVKRIPGAAPTPVRMKPLMGPTKFAPAKATRRTDDPLDALQLEVPDEADDPYNSGRFRRIR